MRNKASEEEEQKKEEEERQGQSRDTDKIKCGTLTGWKMAIYVIDRACLPFSNIDIFDE